MEIYLLRHGIAEEQRAGARDSDRALTAEGKKRLREVFLMARSAGVNPELILTSPYRRAKETAQIAAEVLGTKQPVVTADVFTPMGDVREAWNEIRMHKGAHSVLVSGHEPLTGMLTGYLLNAPQLAIDVKKGCLIRVDVEAFGPQPRGVLKWMLTPRLAAR
ncbi:MAG: phosphohistidine phosphatase SixA [Acidobacteria bacterium]|nr:phosphohistidine phosphatase SixA [Acidobacteriota bacterium]